MTGDERAPRDPASTLTAWNHSWVLLWAVGILALYAVAGWLGVRQLHRYRAESEASRAASVVSAVAGARALPRGAGAPGRAAPTVVKTRITLIRIGDLAVRDPAWTGDFILHFRWSGTAVDPGKTFRIVNGQVLQRELMRAGVVGGERFADYRVSARFVWTFDPSRFPFADEWLTVQLEDGMHSATTLRYLVDGEGSEVDPNALPRSLKLKSHHLGVILHREDSVPAGDGRADGEQVYSRLILGMHVAPVSRSLYATMFQALFASVAIAMLVYFIKPIHVDPRFGLSVGAFFAAVSNNVYVASFLPSAGRLTLASLVSAVGLGTIFLTLVQSTVSLYLFDSLGRDRLSRYFDRVSFAVMLLGYVAVNLALPLAARS